MDMITVIEPHTKSIDEIASSSRSVSMAFLSPCVSQFKEVTRDSTTNIDYQRFYEDRYYKRSHKRLRQGLLDIETLYEERLRPGFLGIQKVYEKMLWGDDEYLLSDCGVEPKKRTELPAQSAVNMEPENNSAEVPLQSDEENPSGHLAFENMDTMTSGEERDGSHEEVGDDPLEEREGSHEDVGNDPQDEPEEEPENNSSEVPVEFVNVDEENPSGHLAFENMDTMTSGEEREGSHEDVGNDPQDEPEESDDHYVATEKSGDGTIIHLICTCGSRYQILVTDSQCYLMLIPLGEDTGYDHAKLVWACKCPTGLHIGLDCPCGHGFVLKKSGPKFFYALS